MKKNLQTESSLRNLLLSSVIILFLAANLFADSPKVRPASEMTGPYIDWMKKVADWQLTQSSWDSSVSWERGALHAGMMACYEATKDEKYLDKCRQWAEKFNWQLGWDNSNHADNMTCAQAYLELYFLDEQDSSRYQDFKDQSDDHVALWPEFACSGTSSNHWWWCDALFMAPPGLVRLSRATGDPIYTNFMHMMWEDTQDCLYDTTEHLFFRDTSYFYPAKQNCNGDKMFWSRGNGWVLAGTARVLQYLPQSDPNRPVYVTLLQEMAGKLKDIQQPDGYWHSDLLGPNCYDNPESSGTGFFTFGIAWGINNGYLNAATYLPTVVAGWDALKAAVQPSGLLGWVQPVGAGPTGTTATTTDVFGVGAYLLAGSEVQKYFLSNDPSYIEFFNTYDSDSELKAVWKDGSTNGTDSSITLGNYGDRFLELEYDNSNSPYDSRVDRTFTTAQNWEVNEFVSLSILIQGKVGNAEDDIYVELEDASAHTKRVYINDTNVVDTYKWFEVAFPFSVFDSVEMDQIKRLSIGVGSETPSSTGTGTIRIDTIRLYPVRCFTTYAADFDDDCKVDSVDFSIIADQWMDDYSETITPVDPGTSNLIAYWKLDETTGTTATDSSYNGMDGTLSGTTFNSSSVPGQVNNALQFDGSNDYVDIPDDSTDFSNGITISLWAYPTAVKSWARFVALGNGPYANNIWFGRESSSDNLVFESYDDGTQWKNTASDAIELDTWQFFAVTVDSEGTVKMYKDGQLIKTGTASLENITRTVNYIGRSNWSADAYYAGIMDEVRIYNTELSHGNILYLADMDPIVTIPDQPRQTDLVLDGKIDLKDLADFVSKWAEKNSWP